MSLFSDLQARDRSRRRERDLGRPVQLVRLTKDGRPSGMRDAQQGFEKREEALAEAQRVRTLNPGRTLRYALHVSGSEPVEI